MLQLFVAYLTLANAFSNVESLEDLVFASAPAFGSYVLQKQVNNPQPLINLEETCFSSNLQDDSEVTYQVGLLSETLSCSDAFEMQASMYSGDVCNFDYPINNNQDTLLSSCGKTFCSECAQVENTKEDVIYAKEVYETLDVGFDMAPGFEYSSSSSSLFAPVEGKTMSLEVEVQGIAAPMPSAASMVVPDLLGDDDALPSLEVPDELLVQEEAKAMIAPLPAPADTEEVVGIEAPKLQDTPIEVSLEAPMTEDSSSSMVPPGLEVAPEAQSGARTAPKRLNRYHQSDEL